MAKKGRNVHLNHQWCTINTKNKNKILADILYISLFYSYLSEGQKENGKTRQTEEI